MSTLGPRLKHTGLGIASFVLSLISGASIFVVLVMAALVESMHPGGMDEKSPVAVFIGFCLFGFMGTAVVGLALGLAGLFQADRKKTFAIIGSVLAAFSLIGTLVLIGIGLASS